ncbi:hypothetical protein [Leptothermofonsia sp. ETS-13]|uniref:hypothetical protein n=1 Tax=Leptothermofonsia sp. ETS-13 TaxID=3035696 RepID=UPI003B9FE6C4
MRSAYNALSSEALSTFDLIATSNPQGFSQRIQAYLTGNYHSIDEIPVNPGGTPFQQQV